MKKFEACEMWMLRRLLKISWRQRVTNKEVLSSANRENKDDSIPREHTAP